MKLKIAAITDLLAAFDLSGLSAFFFSYLEIFILVLMLLLTDFIDCVVLSFSLTKHVLLHMFS